MNQRKKSICIPLFLLLLPAIVILGEFTYFLVMTHSDPVLEKADLIAVFTGEGGRVEEGFRLVNEGYGGRLVVSRASYRSLERFRKKLGGSKAVEIVAEDRSRTTFENALHIERIMSDRGMRTVILVTSWDHMPRSYLLLRILSYSADIQIQRSGVPTRRLDAGNWYFSAEGWKRIHNEMMELWGSLYELAAYRMTGALPQDEPNHSTLVTFLRKALLFELEPIRS